MFSVYVFVHVRERNYVSMGNILIMKLKFLQFGSITNKTLATERE